METLESSVYLLCFITSVLCLWLLARGYRRSRVKLLMWTSLAFVAIAINNFFLFLDVVVFPDSINLLPIRNIAAVVGIVIMFYGLAWETD